MNNELQELLLEYLIELGNKKYPIYQAGVIQEVVTKNNKLVVTYSLWASNSDYYLPDAVTKISMWELLAFLHESHKTKVAALEERLQNLENSASPS